MAVLLGAPSLALAIYPAFVLGQAWGRPLWQSPWLPALFVAGALHVGAAMGAFAEAGLAKGLELATAALELALVGAYALSMGPRHLVPNLLGWVLVATALVGAWIAPTALLFLLRSKHRHSFRIALIVVGCFGLRSAILLAGQSSS